MKTIPLYTITEDNITIPLLGEKYSIEDMTKIFSIPTINEKTIALAINITNINNIYYDIGLLGEINENGIEFTERIYINHILYNAISGLEVRYEPVIEPEEHISDSYLQDLISALPEHLLSHIDATKAIKIIENPIEVLQFLASNALCNHDKITYLQTLNFNKQAELIVCSVPHINTLKVKKELPELINDLAIDTESKESLLKEAKRLSQLPARSEERERILDYLNWTVSLPWRPENNTSINLNKLKKLLNSTHYGLDEVKEHIIELMCIQKLSNKTTGTVICFAGSPGTGKTSIAKAIAEATNRPLIKISLGGLSDSADLNGHRRTYLASRPGRIIAEIKLKKSNAPLILLDEIDKISSFKGDPTGVLLEILDPEQNNQFVDRYLEIPYDLSNVLFICTANDVTAIPRPLLDRMELVMFRSYTKEERFNIMQQYLLPKALNQNYATEANILFTESALNRIADINQIRQIEKILNKFIRKAITYIYMNKATQYIIDNNDVEDIIINYNTESTTRSIGF